MANIINWATGATSRGTVLGTHLNSLANGAQTVAGAEVDNSTNLDQYGILELNVTFGTAPTVGNTCDVYMVKALDGTNYEDGSSTALPSGACLVGAIDMLAGTAAMRRTSGIFTVPPTKIKFLLKNNSGQAFPGSNSTVLFYTFNDEIQ